jgi:hypothetical protein
MTRHARRNDTEGSFRETNMKPLIALVFILTSLVLGVAVTACSDDVGGDYYENEIHNGYPGPGTKSPGRDG